MILFNVNDNDSNVAQCNDETMILLMKNVVLLLLSIIILIIIITDIDKW